METVIRLDGITKYYGKQLGVADLDLEVQAGEIFGYLGPNGAGKTTTIRMLLDLIRPSSGKATGLGLDAQADSLKVRRSVGYIPSDPSLYGNLSGHDFLTYLASIRGGVSWPKVTELADRLQCVLSRPIGALSRGNKQKLAVIRAFMHQPPAEFLAAHPVIEERGQNGPVAQALERVGGRGVEEDPRLGVAQGRR